MWMNLGTYVVCIKSKYNYNVGVWEIITKIWEKDINTNKNFEVLLDLYNTVYV